MTEEPAAAAELSEAHAMSTCVSSAAPETARRMGLAAEWIGGASVTAARRDGSGFWSKVLGLGAREPITAALIDEIIAFYERHGAPRATLQIAPGLLPADWPEIIARHRLAPGATWYKMARDAAPADPVGTALTIAPVSDGLDAAAGASVLARSFGWDEADTAGIYAHAVTHGAIDGFTARDGDTVVAFAASIYHGRTAEMYGAATDPRHRGRGAQSALLAARIEAARARGCTTIYAETFVPNPTNPSYTNLLRSGFTVLYERPSWRWTRP